MARRFKPYDTYQVFFTINFDNQINCENAYTTNYLKTSNGIKYYNPINQIASLPDDYVDDGMHELIIDRTDAGVCNEKGQFTLFKSVSVAYGRKAFRKDINPN